MRTLKLPAIAAMGCLVAGSAAHAALSASAALTLVSTDNSGAQPVYAYSISMLDTGTTTVGTYWNAWLPGQDFMSVAPTAITSPAGWNASITGGNPGNGYAIMWTASSAASYAQPGGAALTFGFHSTDSLAYLSGNSAFYPTTPVETTVVYSAGAFSDAGFTFRTTIGSPVPESSAMALPGALGLALGARRRRR